MTFAYPWALAFLSLPLLVGVWLSRRAGRPVVLPVDHGGAPLRNRLRRWVTAAELLPLAIVGLAVVCLAGPQRATNGPVERDLRNIHILLDSSFSMMTPFGHRTTRHDAAMDAITALAGRQKSDAFALTLYGDKVLNWIPLTQDLGPLRLARPFLSPRNLPQPLTSGTATGLALTTVADQMRSTPAGERMVILVTDGLAADLDPERRSAVIRQLLEARVKVYTVLINPGDGPADMDAVSTATGGAIFRADDPDTLEAVFRRIDAMTTTPMRLTAPRSVDWFFPVVALTVPLVLLHALMLYGVRFTPW